MAQIGDFQDLLNAISTAKDILEPGKLEIMEHEAKLDRRTQLDVVALNLLNEEISELTTRKEELIDMPGVSYLDLEKFPLAPTTGNLQKYAKKKFEDITDALDVMTDRRDRLMSEVASIKKMHAVSQEEQQKLLKVEQKYKVKGAFAHVFERADFDEAQKDYRAQLISMKNDDGRPMYNERDIAMRLHFHNKAYIQQHAVEASSQIQAAFDLQETKFGAAFTHWQNTADPSTVAGVKPAMSFQNVPGIVDEAITQFQNDVTVNAQTMYDSGEWTTENAPIEIVNGVAKYDSSWFGEDYVDHLGNKTGQTRLERIQFDMAAGIQDFLGHANTTEGFKSATKPGSPSNVLLTSTSQNILVPGLGYGNLIWGSQFKLMENFYNQDTIQKLINNEIIKKSTIRDRTMSIIDQNRTS